MTVPTRVTKARLPNHEVTALPAISVVIPTYRRPELLRRCLRHVLSQDVPGDQLEVVVVDDARLPSTAAVVCAIGAGFPEVTLRLMDGPGRGPAAARNVGWRAARGEVIAFIDDDAYPSDHRWLARALKRFAASRALAGLSGKVIVPAGEPPSDYQRNVRGLEQGRFLTCNAFYRKADLLRAGGFDERFTAPFREDTDLEYRLAAAGAELAVDASVRVIHPAPVGSFGISMRLQRYSAFNALLYSKHPERYRRDIQSRPPLLYYAILASLALAGAGTVTRRTRLALTGAGAWALLDGLFFARRARGVRRDGMHLLDLALTSVVIPVLSVYWRLRGAVRYRVVFL